MTIVPDDKSWTWVLERPCDECGFDARSFERSRIGAMVRANVQEWVAVLERPQAAERRRPDRWSDLEYACHVRDVFRVYDGRLARMLAEDGPRYENWDQDATALADDYGHQDPGQVTVELRAAGTALADRFDTVAGADWARPGHRSDGASFTIESFARYFVHDVIHHLTDVALPT
jgi:hypothetical protein